MESDQALQPRVRALLHRGGPARERRHGARYGRVPRDRRSAAPREPRAPAHPLRRRAVAAAGPDQDRRVRVAPRGYGRSGDERDAAHRRAYRGAQAGRRPGAGGKRRFAAPVLPRQLPSRPRSARRRTGGARAAAGRAAGLHRANDGHQGEPRGTGAPGRLVGRPGRRVLQLLLPRLDRARGVTHRSGAGGLRSGARRSGSVGACLPRAHAGTREVRPALHAARASDRSRFPGLELPDALPLRHAVLPHHPRRQADPVPLPAGGRGGSAPPELRRHLALGASVSAAARGVARRQVRCLRVSRAVRRVPGARLRARGGRARRRSVVRVRADGRHGPARAGARDRVRRRVPAGAHLESRGAGARGAHPVVRARRGDAACGVVGAPPGAARSDARAARRGAQCDADRLLQEAAVLRGRQPMTDNALLLLQAAADTTHAYGEFPVIGARAFIWITAEVHLMFAAFVLGVPMFAVVTEAIGIFGGDERYDRLSKEFTRLLLVAYSATAIWGAMLGFGLSTLYPRFWASLTAIFAPSMWLYAALFFIESFTLYLYYYGWDRWKKGRAKLGHWTLGILLNVWGTTVMFIANAWLTYMMSPPRDITPTTDPTTIKLWHAIANATWMPINVHRLIANVVFGGAIVGAYASYRFLAARTDEERAHYDWMGYVGNFIAMSALIVLPFAGYWLGRELYQYDH